jgi:putative DNA primase/helicase
LNTPNVSDSAPVRPASASPSSSDLSALRARFAPHTLPLWPVGEDGRRTCNVPNCTRPGKHPARNAPGPGYAVVTGAESGLFVVDVDVKGGVDGYAELEALGELPKTLTVRTSSGGAHFYFRWPGFPVRNRKPASAIDIKGDKEREDGLVYVVGPGSPGYVKTSDPCVVTPGEPYEIPEGGDVPVADAPEWLLSWLRIGDQRASGFAPEPIDEDHVDWEYRLGLAVEAAREFAPSRADGEAGKSLFALCLRLVRALELPLETAFDLLVEHFNPRCTQPDGVTHYPWSSDDILHKLEDARDRSDIPCGIPSRATTEGFKALAGRLSTSAQRQDFEALKARVAAREAHQMDPDAREEYEAPLAWVLERGDSVELAETVKKVVPGLVFTEGAFYLYDEVRGIWSSDGLEKRLKALVRSMAGTPLGKTVLKLNAPAIGYAMQTLADMVECKDFFDAAAHGLACPNGFLSLSPEGVALVPHAREHRSRVSYPIAYDAVATSECWTTFLQDLFVDDTDGADKISLLGEFFGGSLFGLATMFQRCVIARGDGGNGKSKLLEIMTSMFPSGTVVAFSPQNLEKEYWRARLPGALLNAVAEMPSATVMASENFKAIVTGDEIDAREPMRPVICFKSRAGHFFGANSLPGTTDQSFGFWRRFLVVGFNRNFEAGGADKDIVRKVLAESKEAIFAWLVSGALRLLRQQSYTVPASHEDLLRKWKQATDSVASWRDERTAATDEPATAQRILYRDYQAWAKDGGYQPVAENVFGERMAKAGYPREGKAKWVRLRVQGAAAVLPLQQRRSA